METDPKTVETVADSDELSAQFDTTAISNMFEIFVAPEVRKRGLTIDPRSIDCFLVELRPDGGVDVRLNDEARLTGKLVKAEGGGHYLENVTPQDGEVGPNSGWVAFIRAGEGGTMGFDFRRNLEQARQLTAKAEGFLSGAVKIADDTLSGALDLLYSSAELTVQALMLLQSETDPSHDRRRKWLRRWTDARNSPASHAQVLDNLASLRGSARYSPKDPPLKEGRLERIIATVQDMIDTAHDYAGDRSPVVNVEIAPEFVRHELRTSAPSGNPT